MYTITYGLLYSTGVHGLRNADQSFSKDTVGFVYYDYYDLNGTNDWDRIGKIIENCGKIIAN